MPPFMVIPVTLLPVMFTFSSAMVSLYSTSLAEAKAVRMAKVNKMLFTAMVLATSSLRDL